MRIKTFITVAAAALIMAGCSNKENKIDENLRMPAEEELMGTWIYYDEYQNVDGKWEKLPEPNVDFTLGMLCMTFGQEGRNTWSRTMDDKTEVLDFDDWKFDVKTGQISICGHNSYKVGGIDSNGVLVLYTDKSYNPETGKTDKGEFMDRFKRALPGNQRIVGLWEYVATYKKGEKQKEDAPNVWTEYPLGVPDRCLLKHTADGQSFTINTYKGETRTEEEGPFNIDDKTGVYTIKDEYRGRIIFVNDDNMYLYMDKVADLSVEEWIEGEFYMHFKRVAE